jgi:hypothetical protein
VVALLLFYYVLYRSIGCSGVTLVLNNFSLKPTHPFTDTSNRDSNNKSQSEGGRNCEDAKQGTSEEKETKTGCRK